MRGQSVHIFQIFLCVERRHAASARARDRLAIDVVLHVTGGEHAGNIGGGGVADITAFGFDVAVRHIDLTFENLRVRCVTDGDKNAF